MPRYKRKTARKMKPYGSLRDKDLDACEVFFQTRRFMEVARKFQVSHTTVHKHAEKNNWIGRLADRLAKVQERIDMKLADKWANDMARQYNLWTMLEVNVANTLNNADLRTKKFLKPHEGVSLAAILDYAQKNKRLMVGQPTDRKEITLKDFFEMAHDAAGL